MCVAGLGGVCLPGTPDPALCHRPQVRGAEPRSARLPRGVVFWQSNLSSSLRSVIPKPDPRWNDARVTLCLGVESWRKLRARIPGGAPKPPRRMAVGSSGVLTQQPGWLVLTPWDVGTAFCSNAQAGTEVFPELE